MKHKEKKQPSGFILFLLLLLGIIVGLGTFLVKEAFRANKKFQEIISLESFSYGEEFLKEAEKLQGLCSISPVLEVPVKLKAGDHSMDTVFLGVDLEKMEFSVSKAKETPVGRTPVILLGEKALSNLADFNEHRISEKEQEALLSDFEHLELEYEISQGEEENRFLPLKTAAILKEPGDCILMPLDQAEALLREHGLDSQIRNILLTVQGEQNFEQAKMALSGR